MDKKQELIFLEGDASLVDFARNAMETISDVSNIRRPTVPIVVGGWNTELNADLGRRHVTSVSRKLLDTITHDLRSSHWVQSITLFRGIREKPNIPIGEIWNDTGVVSKSANPKISIDYASNMLPGIMGSLFICRYLKPTKHLYLDRGSWETISYPGEIFIVKMKASYGQLNVFVVDYDRNMYGKDILEPQGDSGTMRFARPHIGKLMTERILALRGQNKQGKADIRIYISTENELAGIMAPSTADAFFVDLHDFTNPTVFIIDPPTNSDKEIVKEFTYQRYLEKKPMTGSLFAFIRDTLLEKIEKNIDGVSLKFESI